MFLSIRQSVSFYVVTFSCVIVIALYYFLLYSCTFVANKVSVSVSVCARFQELAEVLAIDLLLLLDRNSVTTYLFTYVILNVPYWNFAGC